MSSSDSGDHPRNPSEFDLTDHVREDVFADDMRFVDERMIWETIRDGREYAKEGGPGRVRRRLEYDGVDCAVVIDPDCRAVVTAWTEVASAQRALASDRWSSDDIDTILAFEAREHKRGP
jgi:hypothetical protein